MTRNETDSSIVNCNEKIDTISSRINTQINNLHTNLTNEICEKIDNLDLNLTNRITVKTNDLSRDLTDTMKQDINMVSNRLNVQINNLDASRPDRMNQGQYTVIFSLFMNSNIYIDQSKYKLTV